MNGSRFIDLGLTNISKNPQTLDIELLALQKIGLGLKSYS